MSRILESYLDRVLVYANRPEDEAADLRSELHDHLLEKIEDLRAQGLAEADAIYQAVNAHGRPRVVGYGLRKAFPLIDIRSAGTARGVIAIGPKAVGVFAFGGAAFGVFACGGFSVGVFTFGGFSAAALFAFCGIGIATFAYGGMVLGLLAMGGFAAGVVALGGMAIGLLAEGGRSMSLYDSQNAPAFMKALCSVAQDRTFWTWASVALTATLIVLLVVPNVFLAREHRRVREADPWLQE